MLLHTVSKIGMYGLLYTDLFTLIKEARNRICGTGVERNLRNLYRKFIICVFTLKFQNFLNGHTGKAGVFSHNLYAWTLVA